MIDVPHAVKELCKTLQECGYEAVCVGGAVRDAFLGKTPEDWDVATNACPAEVVDVFPRAIPTGIEHGTVTIPTGKGKNKFPVEVTTYRQERGYSDSRHPDAVVFGVTLEEDLSRRDFSVNSIAYDPVSGVVTDPFGGRKDIEEKLLRAVGEPAERFLEDGLRVMRAVRFVSQLDFVLEEKTKSSIPVALGSLERVAKERICSELRKLLMGKGWRNGFASLCDVEGWALVFGPVLSIDRKVFDSAFPDEAHALSWLGRLVFLLHEFPCADTVKWMKGMTFSGEEQKRFAALHSCLTTGVEHGRGLECKRTLSNVRALDSFDDAVGLFSSVGQADTALFVSEVVVRNDALSVGDLALSGSDLISVGFKPGPRIGQILGQLLERVLKDPELNTKSSLLSLTPSP